MNGITVYAKDAKDFSDSGLTGEYIPLSATFSEEKNGLSQLNVSAIYEETGRWKSLVVGNIIKAKVPVRVPPVVRNDALASTVVFAPNITTGLIVYTICVCKGTSAYERIACPFHRYRAGDSINVASLVDTVYAKVNGTNTEMLKAAVSMRDGETVVGYVIRSEFSAMSPATVDIPVGMRGLETWINPSRLQYQLFRIVDVDNQDDSISVVARHVWYDNLHNLTSFVPAENTQYTGANLARSILTDAVSPTGTAVQCESMDQLYGSEFDLSGKNLVECFLSPDGGVCDKYSLAIIRYNWDFYLMKTVDTSRGVQIEYGKNLLSVERSENIEDVITRIVPVAQDENGNRIWLNYNGNKYMDSALIDNYGFPMASLFNTGLKIGQDGVTAENVQARMREKANEEFDKRVAFSEVEMSAEFIALGDTEEFPQYKDWEKVYLLDVIRISHRDRGYDFSAQVIGLEHDVLTGMLNNVTIGDIRKSYRRRIWIAGKS